jgi:hypothetical protein
MPKHIKRLILVFGIFIALFILLQQILRPSSFGELGHYRSDAIEENAANELHYAGVANCSSCHDTVRLQKSAGLHAMLTCEACHGPGLKHARFAGSFTGFPLPDSLVLQKPTERKDCALCHQINAARVKILFDTIDNSLIRQVNALEHNLMSKKTKKERKCVSCHNPHQP